MGQIVVRKPGIQTSQPSGNKQRPIYTLDIETDPFEYMLVPEPFVIGFYWDGGFKYFWGKDCVAEMRDFIAGFPPGIIYIHNGGRFDLFYLMEWLTGKLMIVNSRIIKCGMNTDSSGAHEIRDSYAIMPFALKQYKKDDIDYNKLKKRVRNKHREEIIRYLKSDCVYLYELCTSFVGRFGEQLTIGSTAMKELQKIHKFDDLTEKQDADLRAYYYGGRVQYFKRGVIKGPVKIFDVNSMYPFAMRDFSHPIGKPSYVSDEITKDTCFVLVEGQNNGAFPVRDNSGIRFDVRNGIFAVTIHEYKAAISLGLFEPKRIIECTNFVSRSSFAKFVTTFYDLRNEAKASGNDTYSLFYKFILNSAYGKFAQNPENYFDYQITDASEYVGEGWEPCFIVDDKYIIYKKPSMHFTRHNVATAASITGAARSVLMRAIAKATNPIYCDTDSIICEDLSGVEIHGSNLGAWKLESTGDKIAVAGKKLYAVFNGKECVKHACKGVRITPEEIERVASGDVVQFNKESPSFRWDGSAIFISRRVRAT